MKRKYYDILVVIPLEEELQVFVQFFPDVEDISTPTQFRVVVDAGNPAVRVVAVLQEDMGKGYASKACSAALRDFDAGLVVCLGIAGGLSKDVKIGDVCYSGEILDVYDNSKVSDTDVGVQETKWSPTYHQTGRTITQAVSAARLSPSLKPAYASWQEERLVQAAALSPDAHLGRDGRDEFFARPQTFSGTLACAAVTDSPTYNARLLRINRRLLAVETESGGVFEQAEVHSRPVLVIRGVSDYADPKKGELEQKSKGAMRVIAASNAATFFRIQLENFRFLALIASYRDAGQENRLPFAQALAPSPVTDVLSRVGEDVDAKLRELSPEFRLQPKGYKLPVPRIRLVDTDARSRVAGSGDHPALDVQMAVRDKKPIFLQIPRTYPDQSLAWILAYELLTAELDGKAVVPIVIDGSLVSPPRSGFDHLGPEGLIRLKMDESEATLVFIVNGMSLASPTKSSFLLREVEKWPDARFIFLHRGEVNLAQETDFVTASNSNAYSICDISFHEISMFIQKNFEMSGPEARVIALRLRQTFSQFKLSAHPTYFAGIPKETLSALLQANRRAELIQLAVDGFLTFLVAGDEAQIALSRTTRSRFLRRLALETRALKRSFNQEQLIVLTREFAEHGDFEIDPIAFVQSFVDRGILHFEGGEVRITLPFVEAYLLALELRESDSEALKYFDPYDSEFDMPTFDIYAELGASSEITSRVMDGIAEAIKNLGPEENGEHILLGAQINPEFMRRQERLNKLQEQVKKAIEAVQSDTGDLTEKQRLLDVAEQVEQATSQHTKQRADSDSAVPDRDKAFDDGVRIWAVGAALLGSAAEHLDARTKRKLAGSLIELALVIIDRWTRFFLSIDFEVLKRELSADLIVDRIAGEDSSPDRVRDVKQLISMMVDVLEFNALSEPFRRVLNHLCEEASRKVLGISIENAPVTGALGEVVRAAWLTDVDSRKGVKKLKPAFLALPNLAFLRVNIANHFLSRSYWSKSEIADKLTMLDAASDALKSLGLRVQTAELKMLIKNKRQGVSDADGG